MDHRGRAQGTTSTVVGRTGSEEALPYRDLAFEHSNEIHHGENTADRDGELQILPRS